MSKQYGLIVSKNKTAGIKKPAIFDSDSDSDSGFVKPTGLKTTVRRQDRVLQQKAVEEDPTVFQYDELYDEMDAKRKESKLASKDIARKPKYISKLLATAEKRKRENERRIERQVQKDREAEGEEFKDKESFVTSSYRAKLEELKKLDEEEKRQEYLEAIGDVTKQGNLDGFYRHLYDQQGLYERKVEEEVKEDEPEQKGEKAKNEKLPSKKRKYRKRNQSSDEETETDKPDAEKQLQHLPSNIDADSDFSIDSSDEDEDKKKKEEVLPVKIDEKTEAVPEEQNGEKTENPVEETKEDKTEVVEPKKPKIDYWKKRTIGEVFDDSLRRYFERKSLRESGSYVRPVEILG